MVNKSVVSPQFHNNLGFFFLYLKMLPTAATKTLCCDAIQKFNYFMNGPRINTTNDNF